MKRFLLRSSRQKCASRSAQRAPGRYAEGNSPLGVALIGLIDRRIERPAETDDMPEWGDAVEMPKCNYNVSLRTPPAAKPGRIIDPHGRRCHIRRERPGEEELKEDAARYTGPVLGCAPANLGVRRRAASGEARPCPSRQWAVFLAGKEIGKR